MKFTGEFFIPQNTDQENSNDPGLEIEHKQRYMSVLKLVEGKKVLDIACGEGYGTFLMASVANQVLGVDINAELVEHASQKYKRDNIRYLQGSVSQIPLESNSVDIIISFETLEHVTADVQIQFLAEVKRVLRANGTFIVSTPDKKNYTERYNNRNQFHLHELQKEDFENILKSHFGNVIIYDQGLEVSSLILKKSDYVNRSNLAVLPITNKFHFEGKYLIGLCSDNSEVLHYSISSLVPESERTYFQLIDRIIDLQKEVEELGAWGKKSVEEIGTLREHLADKDNLRSEQAHKIVSLHQQVDTLNIIISEIYASEGYKFLSVFYGIRNKLLPQGSPRHQKLKKIVNWIRRKKGDNIVVTDHTNSGLNKYTRTTPTQFTRFEFPHFSNPKVSIIVPAHNGWEMNYLCLRSIRENTYGVSYEVIFADDASTDETQHVGEYVKNIVHIRNEKNLGFLQNCNHASSFAKGEYIHFLNNDTEVTPDWLSSMVNLMEKDNTIGMTGSKLIYPDGRLQEAGGIIWNDASGWNYGHKQDPDDSRFNYVKAVDYISGASIMIRASLWKEIGGFDIQYSPAYFEDTDLAFEVRKKGYQVIYQPMSKVVHFEGFSHGADNNGQIKEGSIKHFQVLNKAKFLKKWKDVLEKDHFPNAENVFQARDKSQGKKTILVIDHYVPQFDKDAGSRHTFQYLRLLVEMGLNVKFIGDNFFKQEPYTSILQQLGIEVFYGEKFKNTWKEWIIENKSRIDYIYLHRPHIAIKYIDFLRANTNSRILYFGHDLHFYRESKQYEIEQNEQILESAGNWKKLELSIFDKSDMIITPSEKEKEIITKLSGSYKVSTIPLFLFKELNPPIRDFSARKNILFVGGFNHKPNTDAVAWFAKEIWPQIKAGVKDIKFIIVGSKAPDEIKNLEGPDIIVKGYVSDAELKEIYRQVRLVVIPLRYGAGIKGKTLEAMHNGIPIVVTNEGIEGLQGDTSFLQPANDASSFANHVIKLYNNEADLTELSAKEISYIREYFSYDVGRSIFSTILSD